MKPGSSSMRRITSDWEAMAAGMRVIRLDTRLQLLVPLLAVTSLSKGTRGLTFYPGRTGAAMGFAVVVAALAIAAELWATGILGPLLVVWGLGTAGVVMVASTLRPTAFVKPICVRCRLLPVIKEHEAIHLSGVESEKAVWDSMRTRYSPQSLSLDGDPTICPFCPIPKRLRGR